MGVEALVDQVDLDGPDTNNDSGGGNDNNDNDNNNSYDNSCDYNF